MNVVVAGGTGFIGSALVKELSEHGHSVAILSRNPEGKRASELAPLPGVNPVGWDAKGAGDASFSAAIGAADAVVNFAGAPINEGRWTDARKEVLRKSRIDSTRALVQAMSKVNRKPGVLINASAVGYYGYRGDEVCHEDSAPGDDFLARLCADWEAEAAEARKLGVRVVSLRTGMVLAPRGGALEKLKLPFRLFVGGPFASGKQWMSWIHQRDLVRLVLFALDNEELNGPVNATAPDPRRNRDFAKAIGKAMKRPSRIPTPGFALRLALGEFGHSLTQGQRVLPIAAQNAGFEFKYPTLEAALEASGL